MTKVHHFTDLALSDALQHAIRDANYQQLTPVQAASLPLGLAGKDLIVQAQTGSGKTVAFALALLQQLELSLLRIQGMVICPTRELAEQVADELRKLARHMPNTKIVTLCGGVPSKHQTTSLEHGAHLIIGTPGRILDHLQQQRLDLSMTRTLVLDEADRMLDMGFQDDIATIVGSLPATRQTLLFSATYPQGISALAKTIMPNANNGRGAEQLRIAQPDQPLAIQQRFYQLPNDDITEAVRRVLLHHQPNSCVVF